MRKPVKTKVSKQEAPKARLVRRDGGTFLVSRKKITNADIAAALVN
jgi:hypothetical protein